MKRFLIIGGGAAGMLASVYAARNGMEVHLFEQNEKLGKKLFITGKGRCNFTNGCATEELFESFITNPRFLYSAVYGYTNYDVIDFFETAGVKTKMERGGRMFPLSDHSSDIISAGTADEESWCEDSSGKPGKTASCGKRRGRKCKDHRNPAG